MSYAALPPPTADVVSLNDSSHSLQQTNGKINSTFSEIRAEKGVLNRLSEGHGKVGLTGE